MLINALHKAQARLYTWLILAACLLGGVLPVSAQTSPAPLIIISLDGLRPDAVLHADEHGLKVPTLRAFVAGGTYAEGVITAIPSDTFPNHTTIITGVWPIEHGIYGNSMAFPQFTSRTWYVQDFFKDIKTETIFQAANKAGLKTAGVYWPATVGAPLNYNIPEYPIDASDMSPAGPVYSPGDILSKLNLHPTFDNDDITARDAFSTEASIRILRAYKPDLLVIHLTDLDHQEHIHGPFSIEANVSLEVTDGQVKEIQQAALAINPATRISIVSDHGFVAINHAVSVNAILAKAGLIEINPAAKSPNSKPKDWTAMCMSELSGICGGFLKHPSDKAALAKVMDVLEEAKENAEYGIDQILTREDMMRMGGGPNTDFGVAFSDGYAGVTTLTGPVVVAIPPGGAHGHVPTNPQIRTSFFIEGEGIAKGRNLHIIDIRQEAPTFANLLNVQLPAAKLAPLNVKP